MSNPIARLGDQSNHGGSIISGCSQNDLTNGLQTAIDGCMHQCPIPGHGTTPMTSTSTTKINGKSVIRVNVDQAGCGAVITQGSPNRFSN